MKKKKFTKIRENITEVEYKKLLIYLNGKEDLTSNTKNNLRRTFILLYFTGMRVNEVKQLKVKDINAIYDKEELIIVTHKTRKERKLFFSKEAIKQIKKHFVFNDNSKDEDFIIIRFISLLFYFITPKGLRNFIIPQNVKTTFSKILFS